jgi:D-lyxose ketol-isomerase
MKRSEINAFIREADSFMRHHEFYLPPFAHWTPSDWATKGEEAREIVENQLGWDITDFGLAKYDNFGLMLFTIRNGSLAEMRAKTGKLYCEKIMVSGVEQVTPLHFHWNKMEDIINRGGGKLVIQLFNATKEEGLADSAVTASIDGVKRVLRAGDTVVLSPGESISIPPHLYHEFWGTEGRVLAGEVSLVNDDRADNRFYKPVGRFPEIEEDEPPLYLLVTDYPKYYRYATS